MKKISTFFPAVKKSVVGQTREGMDIVEFRDETGALRQIMPAIAHNLETLTEQKRQVYGECCRILGVSTGLGVGRPKILETRKRDAAKRVSEMKVTEEYKERDVEDLLKSKFPELFDDSKSSAFKLSRLEVDEVWDEDAEVKELRSLLDRETSGPLRYIERSFCHVWGTDGSHIGWRTYDELSSTILNAFGYKLKKSTGYDLLKREKALTDSNDIQAFKKRPDIGAMLSKLTQAQSGLESMQTEPNMHL